MTGLICALLSVVAALACFVLRPDLVAFAFILAALLAFVAVIRKARPIFLLLAFLIGAEVFAIHPLGLQAVINRFGSPHGVTMDLGNLVHFIAALLGALFIAALVFMISCRKHPGGARFSAYEASGDIESVITGFARLSALFYLPLLILPLYFASTATQPVDQLPLNLVSWQDAPMLSARPEIQMFVWFSAIIMLGGMAAACVGNVHHRYLLIRQKQSPRIQAWFDIVGSLLLLLPACWVMTEAGWAHATLARDQSAVTMALDALLPGLSVPQWGFYIMFPAAFLLLGLAGLSLILRSLIFLYGPHYLVKRSATHLELVSGSTGKGDQPSAVPSRSEGRVNPARTKTKLDEDQSTKQHSSGEQLA
ncbi:TRAP transporter small permease subunit [Cohaesibacter sp. CAU 1516]|uniref:TRAP transporter small permease subunit n=1 Tax=Cohaesibacter sp. CAU 1516 TaxID=2576038 RepID=UPI0010FF3D6D|nr:TRAP transporter small permease subunit [Cohaesibacter sp. CAU 1516]TLP45629.1 TRAP transporter small permease subunit [Cohaesibacter sp. CAU 1516]